MLWEILVPCNDNDGNEFPLKHHRAWDERVRTLAGGLTIMKTAKGQWVSPNNELFREPMIPVRVYCDESTIRKIIDITMHHYDQLAVMAYLVSDRVLLMERDAQP